MLPLHDNIPTRRFPIICTALILANVLVFLADQMSSVEVVYQTASGQAGSRVLWSDTGSEEPDHSVEDA